MSGFDAVRRDLVRERESLDEERATLVLQRSELVVRADEAKIALRVAAGDALPVADAAAAAVGRLEAALRAPARGLVDTPPPPTRRAAPLTAESAGPFSPEARAVFSPTSRGAPSSPASANRGAPSSPADGSSPHDGRSPTTSEAERSRARLARGAAADLDERRRRVAAHTATEIGDRNKLRAAIDKWQDAGSPRRDGDLPWDR